jgi:hypothetical protein
MPATTVGPDSSGHDQGWRSRITSGFYFAVATFGTGLLIGPSDLHLSPKASLALAGLAGTAAGATWEHLSPRDVMDRLVGPAAFMVGGLVLLLVPVATWQVSVVGYGLEIGVVNGLVLVRYRRTRSPS